MSRTAKQPLSSQSSDHSPIATYVAKRGRVLFLKGVVGSTVIQVVRERGDQEAKLLGVSEHLADLRRL